MFRNGLFEVDLANCMLKLTRGDDTSFGLVTGRAYHVGHLIAAVDIVKSHPFFEVVRDASIYEKINDAEIEFIKDGVLYQVMFLTRPIYDDTGKVVGLRGSWEEPTAIAELLQPASV